MQSVVVQSEYPAAAHAAAAVSATDLVRRYGEGDTAVYALRNVSIDIAAGQLTAVMGPSGSGKSTLMHILAGPRPADRAARRRSPAPTSRASDDTQLTKLRREHIGFIFQFFNLLPMLTAVENILLPLDLAGERPDREWLDRTDRARRPRRPAQAPPVRDVRRPAAACGRGPRPGSRPTVMFADEPTGNLDSRTGEEILSLLRESVDALGQTTVMVTHDAHAAAIADRVLFLADGEIVRDIPRSSAREILATLEE